MGTRAAVYARISNDRTGEEAGVDRQQQDATEQAEKRGWTVVATLVDNDLSASRYAKRPRPAYKDLLRLIETGQIDAVVVWHIDRLYREPRELEHLIDLVEQHGVAVATCYGDLDLETGDGRIVARIHVAVAAKSSDDKSRRIKRKHEEIASAGGYNGGKRPFGYESDGVTIRESEAALIRDAAARVLAGESVRSIVREWTTSGVPTVTGATWQTTTLKRMLLTPRIAGYRTHKGRETPAVWPAIISESTRRRLTAKLTDPQRNHVAGVQARRYLLTGLVYCGGCGTRMTTHRGRYVCSRERGGCGSCGISGRLETDVTEAVIAAATSAKVRKRMTARASEGDETALLNDIADAETELTLLARDLADKRIGRDAFAAAATAIEQRLDNLRRQLNQHLARAEVVILADHPEATWEQMGLDRQRAAIGQLVSKITVTPSSVQAGFYDFERVKIHWT